MQVKKRARPKQGEPHDPGPSQHVPETYTDGLYAEEAPVVDRKLPPSCDNLPPKLTHLPPTG